MSGRGVRVETHHMGRGRSRVRCEQASQELEALVEQVQARHARLALQHVPGDGLELLAAGEEHLARAPAVRVMYIYRDIYMYIYTYTYIYTYVYQ